MGIENSGGMRVGWVKQIKTEREVGRRENHRLETSAVERRSEEKKRREENHMRRREKERSVEEVEEMERYRWRGLLSWHCLSQRTGSWTATAFSCLVRVTAINYPAHPHTLSPPLHPSPSPARHAVRRAVARVGGGNTHARTNHEAHSAALANQGTRGAESAAS